MSGVVEAPRALGCRPFGSWRLLSGRFIGRRRNRRWLCGTRRAVADPAVAAVGTVAAAVGVLCSVWCDARRAAAWGCPRRWQWGRSRARGDGGGFATTPEVEAAGKAEPVVADPAVAAVGTVAAAVGVLCSGWCDARRVAAWGCPRRWQWGRSRARGDGGGFATTPEVEAAGKAEPVVAVGVLCPGWCAALPSAGWCTRRLCRGWAPRPRAEVRDDALIGWRSPSSVIAGYVSVGFRRRWGDVRRRGGRRQRCDWGGALIGWRSPSRVAVGCVVGVSASAAAAWTWTGWGRGLGRRSGRRLPGCCVRGGALRG